MRRALALLLALAPLSAQALAPGLRDPRHLSFDAKGVNVRGLLSFLAESGGMNVVLMDDVGGTVTIKVHDFTWERALKAVLKAKHLEMEAEGNILRIGTATTFEQERKLREQNEED
jgi:type IV pilus assembly protein PilQ